MLKAYIFLAVNNNDADQTAQSDQGHCCSHTAKADFLKMWLKLSNKCSADGIDRQFTMKYY